LALLLIPAIWVSQARAADVLRSYDDCLESARNVDRDRKKGKDPSRRQYTAVFDSDHFELGEYDRFEARAPLVPEIWFLGAFPSCAPRPNRILSSFTVASGEQLAAKVDELEFSKLLELKRQRKLKLVLTLRPVDIKVHPMPPYDAKACPGEQPAFSHADLAPQVFIQADKGHLEAPGNKRYPMVRVVDGSAQDITSALTPGPAPQPSPADRPVPDRSADLDTYLSKLDAPEQKANSKPGAEIDWRKVSKVAADKRLDVATRGLALKKFIQAYPDAKPQRQRAETLLRNLWPGELVVHAEPEDAWITIAGKPGGKAPVTRKLKAGIYEVKAGHKGYLPGTQKVEITPGERAEIVISLSTIPGTLSVTSQPQGASLWLNGKPAGVTPLTTETPSGSVLVKASLAGYQDVEQTVQVLARRSSQLSLTLDRGLGKIKVETTPPGAMVSIDGKQVGLSPLELDLLTGSHPVSVTLDGYSTQERQVTIDNDKTTAAEFALAEAPPGILVVVSEPPGATLTINGLAAGVTPKEGQVKPGTYKVGASMPGWLAQEKEVRVHSELPTELLFQLEQVPPGKLVVQTEPAGASVSLDQEPMGVTPLDKEVAAGTRQMVVQLDGYENLEQPVDIQAGQPAVLNLTLKKIPIGSLEVRSFPPGAEVSIGGQVAGKTPLTIPLAAGSHDVGLSMPGFTSARKTVLVQDGKRSEFELTLPEVRVGSLSIQSLPPGAQVAIDGQVVGVTPLKKEFKPGSYSLSLRLEGYRRVDRVASVDNALQTEVVVPLELVNPLGTWSRWGHTSFWTGLALAGLGSLAAVRSSTLADEFRAQSWDTDADDRSRTWAGVMYGSLITGGLLMIAGVVFWGLPEQRGPQTGATASDNPAHDGVAASWGGHW
jgi:hypothetical protein